MADHKHFETQAIRIQAERNLREHAVPIYATSSFVFENAEEARAMFAGDVDGNIYTRFSNPNNNEFIEKLCALEGTEDGMPAASGMGAVFLSMMAFLKAGDHIVACRSVFGSTHQVITGLLPRWGITHTYVPVNEPEKWEAAIQPNTKMLVLETPSNPAIDLVDLEWAGQLAERHGILLNVDNCFATPYLQNPAKFGAHIVTHSATKFLDGQGRVIGGAVLGSKEHIAEVRFLARHSGPALSPFNSWVLSKSIETLAVRMDRHCDNAEKVADFLENNENVNWVKYPFSKSHPQYELAKKQMKRGGALVTFEIKGGLERGRRFLDSLQMFSLTANLGDTRSIATHPASTTHSKLSNEEKAAVNITPGLVRLSCGLEHIDDILADLTQAFAASA